MNYREKFTEYFKENIQREGSDKLLEWLEKSDFFFAPASTRFHLACFEGLVQHSINVYEVMRDRFFEEGENMESYAICGLLHDVCKANFYQVSYRNVKNEEDGRWDKVPYYSIDEKFPYGHGEKSVFLIERFMRLTIEEAVAIRWHMGGFDEAVKGGNLSISSAYEKYPIACKLHMADFEATYLREGR